MIAAETILPQLIPTGKFVCSCSGCNHALSSECGNFSHGDTFIRSSAIAPSPKMQAVPLLYLVAFDSLALGSGSLPFCLLPPGGPLRRSSLKDQAGHTWSRGAPTDPCV